MRDIIFLVSLGFTMYTQRDTVTTVFNISLHDDSATQRSNSAEFYFHRYTGEDHLVQCFIAGLVRVTGLRADELDKKKLYQKRCQSCRD